MKTFPILGSLAVLMLTLGQAAPEPAQAAGDLSTLLQRGLFEEEANRDLPKAAVAYEEILAQYTRQRAYAATALFRLAELRLKLGAREEAGVLYQRLLAEFPQDELLRKLSQERLAALGLVPKPEAPPAATAATAKEAEELLRIQEIVQNSPDLLNATGSDGQTPLGRAAGSGWMQVATYLLDHGAKVDGADAGTVPLSRAAEGGHKRMVELLLARGAQVNLASGNGWTALHLAAAANRLEVARVLLEHGAQPGPVGRDKPHWEATPLLMAARNGSRDMAALLLDAGAELDQANPGSGDTPLIVAVREHQASCVRLLLERGAKVESRNLQGSSALYCAAFDGPPELVELLLARGAPVNDAGANHYTPLHFAASRSVPIALRLLEAGARAKVAADDGDTPLLMSVRCRREQTALGHAWTSAEPAPEAQLAALPTLWRALVARGAKLEAVTPRGGTVLAHACENADISVENIGVLLALGADPLVVTSSGGTPFQYADPERRRALEERYLFEKWAAPEAITAVSYTRPAFQQSIPRGAPAEAAPNWGSVLEKLPTIGVKTSVTVYRRGWAGLEAAEHFVASAPDAKSKAGATLRWGDLLILEPGAPELGAGSVPPALQRRVRIINPRP